MKRRGSQLEVSLLAEKCQEGRGIGVGYMYLRRQNIVARRVSMLLRGIHYRLSTLVGAADDLKRIYNVNFIG